MSTNEAYYNDTLLPKLYSGDHVAVVVTHSATSTHVSYYYVDEDEPDETNMRRASVKISADWGEPEDWPEIEDRKEGVDWVRDNDWPEPEHDTPSGTDLHNAVQNHTVYIVDRDDCPVIN